MLNLAIIWWTNSSECTPQFAAIMWIFISVPWNNGRDERKEFEDHFLFIVQAERKRVRVGVKLFEMGWHPNFDLPNGVWILMVLTLFPLLPLPFSLYLRHVFCSESEDVEWNRVKHNLIERIYTYLAHIYIFIHANQFNSSDLVWQGGCKIQCYFKIWRG